MAIPVHAMPTAITSIAILMAEIQSLHDIYRCPVWLRGHGDEIWTLRPTVGRPQHFLGGSVTLTRRQEDRLLHQFRRYAYVEWGRKLDLWEALFLGRHHGLPVRVMDWTANPLVALYFAVEYARSHSGNATIWAFRRRRDADITNVPEVDVFGTSDPFSVQGVRMIYPFYNAQRMIGQKGAFTIHQQPDLALEDQTSPLVPNSPDVDIVALHRWTVPADRRPEIGNELEHIDINRRRLFPDLDGLAAGLVNAEVLKQYAKKYSP